MDNRKNEQADDRPSIEELFQRLPPLDSDDYIQHIRTARTEDLPAEVLARAFRQLPPETPAARATLDRLLGRVDGRWEYLGPVAAKARRKAKVQRSRDRAAEAADFLKDAIVRIYCVLPTTRGELAERAWNVFCDRAFVDAWREQYGRRGEKLPWVREDSEYSSTDDNRNNSIDRLPNEEAHWRAIWEHDNRERIEAIVAAVASAIPDPFAQEVARAAWGSNERPKTSGNAVADRDPPLTARFPGRSRHQINRALRQVDSRLAEALLAEPSLDWSVDCKAFLEQQANRGKR